MYSSDYRERAKESLSGRWFEPVMVNVILIMISASTGWITEVIPQLTIFSIIISGPLYLGVAFYFSQFIVNKDLGIRDTFYGLTTFGVNRSCFISLLVYLRYYGCSVSSYLA